MTKFFLYGLLALGLSALAVGWISAGVRYVGWVVLGLIPISLFLVYRKFLPTLSLALAFCALAAAAGLWFRVGFVWALTALLCVLAAWDLDGFSRRLACAAAEDNPALIERRHLFQLSLALLLALGLNLFSQSIRFVYGFEWALGLAFLACFGIGALVNSMRSGD